MTTSDNESSNVTRNVMETWVEEACLALPDATTDSPWGPDVKVFRLQRKVFAMTLRNDRISEFALVNLKADPQEISLLIDTHDFIIPGYHMNKKHWISVVLRPDLDREFLEELIEDSYDYVALGLPVALRPLGRGTLAAGAEPATEIVFDELS